MAALTFVMSFDIISLQDWVSDTYLLAVMGLYLFSFLMSGARKYFGRGLSDICISVNSWGPWWHFLDCNLRTSLSCRLGSVASWVGCALTRTPTVPGLGRLLLRSASPPSASPPSALCSASQTGWLPLPPPPLVAGFLQDMQCAVGVGVAGRGRVSLPFFLCFPSSSLYAAAPNRPSMLPAAIRWPRPWTLGTLLLLLSPQPRCMGSLLMLSQGRPCSPGWRVPGTPSRVCTVDSWTYHTALLVSYLTLILQSPKWHQSLGSRWMPG